jgi:hypothetical protein
VKKHTLFLFALVFFSLFLSVQAQDNPSGPDKLDIPTAITGEPVPKTLYAHSFASPSSLYTIDLISASL